jgi:hypothetical protein
MAPLFLVCRRTGGKFYQTQIPKVMHIAKLATVIKQPKRKRSGLNRESEYEFIELESSNARIRSALFISSNLLKMGPYRSFSFQRSISPAAMELRRNTFQVELLFMCIDAAFSRQLKNALVIHHKYIHSKSRIS